ncbi:L-lysine permease [Vibrio maritimus]|uniref:L-lysine permease n=1 Tax=Vibrio maritimus TaxID=990268 RepID=A0A090S9M0_9VIBR|nr:L-lysine permease [Vibrio maritimus]
MNEITILVTLATVHFVALMSPGPDFALVVQNATRFGRQTGFYIALGLSFGILLHSIFSLTGVSYVVHQHPTLFAVVQIAGGSYLLYLGIGALRSVWVDGHSATSLVILAMTQVCCFQVEDRRSLAALPPIFSTQRPWCSLSA